MKEMIESDFNVSRVFEAEDRTFFLARRPDHWHLVVHMTEADGASTLTQRYVPRYAAAKAVSDLLAASAADQEPTITPSSRYAGIALVGKNQLMFIEPVESGTLHKSVLDAWCHLRNDLRSFAVDGIRKVDLTDKKTQEVPEAQLKEHFSESYGIFSGKATKRAKLKFSAQRARWVAGETWHGKQVGTFLPDGSYVLEFDYDKDPELIMDILKHGSEVEVLEPAELRRHVQQALQATISKYQN